MSTMLLTATRRAEAFALPHVSNFPLVSHNIPGFIAPAFEQPSLLKRRRRLPAVWMRAGTSKGLYLHRRDLPANLDDWASVITRVMGSYDSDPKQLNGIGGATSTTSKVAVISPSTRPGIDIDYTFVQVSIGSPKLDLTGNCGNIASGVGPFAVDEGLVAVRPGQNEVQVRIFNTNTESVLTETLQVDETGHFLEDGDCTLPGLCSVGSRVQMSFSKPAGSMTGKLLPSGRPTDVILIQPSLDNPPLPIRVSLVDAANPFVLIDGSSLPGFFYEQGAGSPESLAFIEIVRRNAAVLMGLAQSSEQAANIRGTPKIAVLFAPESQAALSSPDFQCLSYSMGKVHGSLQLTGAVCLATAACIEGTVAYTLRSKAKEGREEDVAGYGTGRISMLTGCDHFEKVKLRHPGGDMEVDVRLGSDGLAKEVAVFRTARRLFEGNVYYLE